jgi:hypothetical protein
MESKQAGRSRQEMEGDFGVAVGGETESAIG